MRIKTVIKGGHISWTSKPGWTFLFTLTRFVVAIKVRDSFGSRIYLYIFFGPLTLPCTKYSQVQHPLSMTHFQYRVIAQTSESQDRFQCSWSRHQKRFCLISEEKFPEEGWKRRSSFYNTYFKWDPSSGMEVFYRALLFSKPFLALTVCPLSSTSDKASFKKLWISRCNWGNPKKGLMVHHMDQKQNKRMPSKGKWWNLPLISMMSRMSDTSANINVRGLKIIWQERRQKINLIALLTFAGNMCKRNILMTPRKVTFIFLFE